MLPDGSTPSFLEVWLHHTQRWLLWLLLACYLLGACLPGPALALRSVDAGQIRVGGSKLELSAPLLMLAFLLFNAGFGARVDELRHLLRAPGMLTVGLVANTALPVLYALSVVSLLSVWPEPDETQDILAGLALIGAMPIAGASTAWAQNTEGNLALSLGLVLGSTLLSPVLTPLVLHALAAMATGDHAAELSTLAHSGAQLFLAFAVVVPSLTGILVRRLLPDHVVQRALPVLKLLNLLVLLSLNYSNAALALPAVLHSPDLDFLALIVVIVALLCSLAFWAGVRIARSFGGSAADTTSLMFGLGMNNNGTGLVLASTAFAAHPR